MPASPSITRHDACCIAELEHDDDEDEDEEDELDCKKLDKPDDVDIEEFNESALLLQVNFLFNIKSFNFA